MAAPSSRVPAATLADVGAMRRALPHDITNALGRVGAGARVRARRRRRGRHGAGHVRRARRTAWNTSPTSTVWRGTTTPRRPRRTPRPRRSAASRGIVLIAGGYDKGVDLSPMAAEPDRVDAVIAIGNTGPALAGAVPSVVDRGRGRRPARRGGRTGRADRLARSDRAAVARLCELRPVRRIRGSRRPFPDARRARSDPPLDRAVRGPT